MNLLKFDKNESNKPKLDLTITLQEVVSRIEKQLKKRFAIGSQVSAHAISADFSKQGYSESAVHKVIGFMIRRGELQHRMQRKVLYRIK